MNRFQLLIHNFIKNKLNDSVNNDLAELGIKFNLFSRYAVQEQDFYDVVLNSINWEDEQALLPPYEGFTINTEFSTLAQLNAAGNSYKVSGVVYELATLFGSVLTYFLTYDFSNNTFIIVNRDLAPYNTYDIDDLYRDVDELNENLADTKYVYVIWDTEEEEYVEVDRTESPYNSYEIVTEYGFLAELISRGDFEQKTDRIYRVFREETLFELPLPEERYYVTYDSETDNYDQIAPNTLFNPKANPANNVVVEYDGTEYNTYLGQYILNKINYIPAIIEDFIAEFEPLDFVDNSNYTIPITFYINETFNKQIDNKIVISAEAFQNKIRGKVENLFDSVSGVTYKMLMNHTAFTPLTGIIDFNGTIFREYQLVLTLEVIDTGYFGNQIIYNISIPKRNSQDVVPGNGETFQVFPIAASSTKAAELHGFQTFGETDFESKSMPNESGFMVELSFLYTGDAFTKWLYREKFISSVPRVINLLVRYPGVNLQETPPSKSYVIESIGGIEQVGEKIILSLVLKPVSNLLIPSSPIPTGG